MDRNEFESYIIRKGWRDTKYAPPEATMLHKEFLDSGGSGIYEKESFAHRRLKLLTTLVRIEYKYINKWKLVMSIYYKDLKHDPKSDKLYVRTSPDNITSRSEPKPTCAHNQRVYIP